MATVKVWDVVEQERMRLVEELRLLPAESFAVGSLCEGWDVHDVLAHLIDTAKTSRLRFIVAMARARGGFDRANAAGIARERRADPQATVAELARVVSLTRTPPAPLATRLVEAFVHGEDIRRPLGLTGEYPPAAVVAGLDYQCRTSASMGGSKALVDGVRLEATDADFVRGHGLTLSGAAMDILLAVTGRPVATAALCGPGAERVRERVAKASG
ncbi:maleylpyruvate isomerase family mycothiol-dependent enzyme [Williamsia sp. MIQD14]|uniref:maleylpyruvate isomerase family mycothiol-dependent enzyme n=1 Tax=Williamsia sp. MIQD14 TaxID=3425703 RepID=UPI003DA112F2